MVLIIIFYIYHKILTIKVVKVSNLVGVFLHSMKQLLALAAKSHAWWAHWCHVSSLLVTHIMMFVTNRQLPHLHILLP